MASDGAGVREFEWPTLVLLTGCYILWALATTWLAALWLPLGIIVTTLMIVLHSSLTHELVHGHPFKNPIANAALVFPCLGLFVPYGRFRDLHLAHHEDANLTDPYDDPETNYLDPGVWSEFGAGTRAILNFNNTLLGRMLIGPVIGMYFFIKSDARAIRAGDRAVRDAWLWQIPAVVVVMLWVIPAAMPVRAYLLSAYLGFSVLKIRTFLEHQAHEKMRGRSVIVEDRGMLSWLFLNNNLHVVHHMHPKTPWYKLPALYLNRKTRFQSVNEGYVYRSYAQVFRRYFLKAKDPVPHPLWPRR